MTLRLVRRLYFLGVGVSVLLVLCGGTLDIDWALLLGLLLLAATVALEVKYWRCPFCGEHLDRNLFASYCPRYGEELDYDQDLRGLL